jgi:hypothetical protein
MTALPATFASLGITDVRDSLSVVASTPAGCRRARNAPVASATLHFNGPPVGVFGKPQAELYHVIAIDTPNHQARIGADSLQYHLVVLSDGSIYQTRDLAYAGVALRQPTGQRDQPRRPSPPRRPARCDRCPVAQHLRPV